MSDPRRVEGNRVYCHICEHEWDRAHGGLQCPQCESEFVEVIDPSAREQTIDDLLPPLDIPTRSQPTSPIHDNSGRGWPNPFANHNPWAPDPDEDDITSYQFNTNNGRGTFSFTSRTYTFGGGARSGMDPAAADISRNLEALLGNLLGVQHNVGGRTTMSGGGFFQFPPHGDTRSFGAQTNRSVDPLSMLFGNRAQGGGGGGGGPFELFGALLNSASGQHGDYAFSQEAFDRVMTQLMEQNQSNGAPGPASDAAINALQKKVIDQSMMGDEGKAECSICMDNVEIGTEVTVLPCKHWFHGDCVISWLKEHDTCPHCRQSISTPAGNSSTTNQSSSTSRRRSSRRSSSVASPLAGEHYDGSNPDTPSGLREARQRYYGSQTDSPSERPQNQRHSSDRQPDGANGNGLGGWIRNHMPFN